MAKKDAPNKGAPHGFCNKPTPAPIREAHSHRGRPAKTRPKITVIKVKRRPPALSPALALRVAISMDKLLLTRTDVMLATFVLLEDSKGWVESGAACLL